MAAHTRCTHAPAFRRKPSFTFELNRLSREIDAALIKRAGGAMLASAAVLGFAALPAPAWSLTFAVDNTTDGNDDSCSDGDCSLREAIAEANASVGADTVDASGVTGTIALTNGQMDITEAITINGPGADRLTVDAGATSRIFNASSSATSTTLSGFTLANGSVSFGGGGAIFAANALTLDGVTVRDSYASGDGGGFFAGGITTVINSTISGNSGSGSFGGGGFFAGGDTTVTNSTISGNSTTADIGGGGFYVQTGDATVINSTITGNTAYGSDRGYGGGFYLFTTNATLINTIVANNHANNFDEFSVLGFVYATYSLVYGDSRPSITNGTDGNIIGVDPQPGPLQYNGGSTRTHAIDASSPAYNAGNPGFTPPPYGDQRGPGFARVYAGTVDMGAYEFQGPPQMAPGFVVTNLDDPGNDECTVGACTLREAVAAANTSAGADEVTFDASLTGTIVLNGTEIAITEALTITGPGADVLTVDANDQSRIFNATSVTTITGLTLANGNTTLDGGAILTSANLYLDGVTIRDSYARYDGGAFFVLIGDATLANSTVSGNTADSQAGGFRVDNGNATLTNSTVSGNTATDGDGGFLALGNATITNSTIANNAAGTYNGGFYANNATLTNSIVADNTAPDADEAFDVPGTLSASYSLVEGSYSAGTGDLNGNGNIKGQDPILGPLQDNGGPTYTHAIGPDSPVFNAGDPTPASPPAFDQRGQPNSRIAGGRLDMGAYEYNVIAADGALIVNALADSGDGLCQQPPDGDCTLREAVYAANNFDNGPAVADEITFDASLSGEITLGGTEIQITDELTLTGPGADVITVDANDQSRIFYATDATSTTTITGLTLTNGNTPGYGGAIRSRNDLTLESVTISSSYAGDGGGGIAGRSTIDLYLSSVTTNTAAGQGGGVFTSGSGALLNSEYSTISDNEAAAGGGFYLAEGGGASLHHSLLSGNRAVGTPGDFGGGRAHNVVVQNSTVSGNSATGDVGGIEGLVSLHLEHSTVTLNTAAADTGGLRADLLYIDNSIVSGNSAATNDDINDIDATPPYIDYSLIGVYTGPVTGTGNFIGPGYDADLQALAANGGPTLTHAIAISSDAYNAGDPAFAAPPDFDQRGSGFARQKEGRIDMGAFELRDTDDDGMPDYFENNNGLNPDNPGDAHGDSDGDGSTNLEEFQTGTDLQDPDTDGDGLGDGVDGDPLQASNICTGADATFGPLSVLSGQTAQCAAANSVTVASSLDIQSGGRVEVFTPNTIFQTGFSVPVGAVLAVEATGLPAIANSAQLAQAKSDNPAPASGLPPPGMEAGGVLAALGGVSAGETISAHRSEAGRHHTPKGISAGPGAATPIPALSPLALLLLPFLIPIAGWRYMRKRRA